MFKQLFFVSLLAACALAAPLIDVEEVPLERYGIVDFPCRVENFTVSGRNVHELQPSDIKVVGAVGDSITAAFGAASRTIVTVWIEWRGLSWAVGGDEEFESVLTVPNIMRKWNPNLTGMSYGKGKDDANLNVAVTGAIAQDIPSQVRDYIDTLKQMDDVDYENDWKLLTLWIGGNDLCRICDGNPENQPANYIKYIEESLDTLHAEVPRLFVNLVLIIDVTKLYKVQNFACEPLHRLVCPCGTDKNETARAEVAAYARQMQQLTMALANSTKYETRDDFAVVAQPFFVDTDVPIDEDGNPDRSYFAPDCFHFAVKAHEAAAVALWNNMLEPVGAKRTAWVPGEPIECPTRESPFLRTKYN